MEIHVIINKVQLRPVNPLPASNSVYCCYVNLLHHYTCCTKKIIRSHRTISWTLMMSGDIRTNVSTIVVIYRQAKSYIHKQLEREIFKKSI